jgi:uncharacterized protein YqeY
MKMPCSYKEMKDDPTCNIGEVMLDQIKKDLTIAMKKGYKDQKSALRMILGEIPRLNLKKGHVPTDEQIISIIKTLIKSEQTVCNYSGQDDCTNEYIDILSHYLPQMMNKAEIQSWIVDNINLSSFDPKIKAMGVIMKHLKGKADGALVKEVLGEIEDFIKRADNL